MYIQSRSTIIEWVVWQADGPSTPAQWTTACGSASGGAIPNLKP